MLSVLGGDDMLKASIIAKEMRKVSESGKELTVGNIFDQMAGYHVEYKALGAVLNDTHGKAREINSSDAKKEQDTMLKGITRDEVTNIKNLNASHKAVEDKQRDSFNPAVKMSILADNMTVTQMELGENATQSIVDNFSKPMADIIREQSGLWKTYRALVPEGTIDAPLAPKVSPEMQKAIDSQNINVSMNDVAKALTSMVDWMTQDDTNSRQNALNNKSREVEE
jgi:hypothetical protein